MSNVTDTCTRLKIKIITTIATTILLKSKKKMFVFKTFLF